MSKEIHKDKDMYQIGYFHSGKSLIAHSGDGGDYGDEWWVVNKHLSKWLSNVIKKGEQALRRIKKRTDAHNKKHR